MAAGNGANECRDERDEVDRQLELQEGEGRQPRVRKRHRGRDQRLTVSWNCRRGRGGSRG